LLFPSWDRSLLWNVSLWISQ